MCVCICARHRNLACRFRRALLSQPLPWLTYSPEFLLKPPDGGKIARLDPEHPSLTAFEIVYKWRGVSGEDFSMGVFIMFILCLVSLVLLSVFVYANYEGPILNSKSKQRAPSRGSSSSSHRDFSSSSSSESVSASSPLSGAAIRRHHSGYRSPMK